MPDPTDEILSLLYGTPLSEEPEEWESEEELMGSPRPPVVPASPDFSQPEWAKRLQEDVPRLAASAGIAPPPGMDLEDWLQELRLTLILRSTSERSQWKPSRGRTTWAGWAILVMKSKSINLWRYTQTNRSQLVAHGHSASQALVEDYSGSPIWGSPRGCLPHPYLKAGRGKAKGDLD